MSLQQALAFTLPAEGGLVNNALDPGGKTNHGITQHTFDSYRDSLKLPRQDVQLITDADTAKIYEQMYWEPSKCPLLPDLLAICHFDTAVNLGVTGAIKLLQRTMGIDDDGVFGPHTQEEVTHQGNDLIIPYLDERRAKYRQVVAAKPSQEIFLKGWLARCNSLEDYVSNLK